MFYGIYVILKINTWTTEFLKNMISCTKIVVIQSCIHAWISNWWNKAWSVDVQLPFEISQQVDRIFALTICIILKNRYV